MSLGESRHSVSNNNISIGIQSIEDAKLAVQAGVDGIVVSNHGKLWIAKT
jgi:isopentenyl diphosphate isomerase/L-lactate dehydrogenase-like FMN-dependent dehydrogenase